CLLARVAQSFCESDDTARRFSCRLELGLDFENDSSILEESGVCSRPGASAMSSRTIISTLSQIALRTLVVMMVAGLIITAVYLPVRWSGVSEPAERLENARRRLPPEYRERLERERRERGAATPAARRSRDGESLRCHRHHRTMGC